jgi:hypothetical protein
MKLRMRRTPGRHWKLMTATLASFTVAGFLLVASEHLAAGIAVLVGIATLAVQWLCIDPPDIDDAELH